MSIKIYGDLGSGSLRRVATAAKIMGIDYERVNIDLFKGESHTPDFLKLNPHGLTPVLKDNDFVLWESSAINLYLADKVESALLGKNEQEKYEVLQWMFWSGEQWRIFSVLLFDERVVARVTGQECNTQIVNMAMDKIRSAAHVLDEHLASRPFIVGDNLTLADIDIAAPFSQINRSKGPFNEFSHLSAWHQRLLDTIPAWAETKRELDQRMDTFFGELGISF
ncbi:Disulfide-bond oxidoreductase YfcG [Thalassocella blandensis]|nr:Disulfide-bond oxidoreductase YfcG [Thalassocella blandensis]